MKDSKYAAKNALQLVPFFNNLQDDEAKISPSGLLCAALDRMKIIFHHGDRGGLLYIIVREGIPTTLDGRSNGDLCQPLREAGP